MNQLINDDESIYICEDLAYKIIRYTNLGVIEVDYIDDSSLKLALNSAEKYLEEKFAKELLSYMLSISKPLSYIKYFI